MNDLIWNLKDSQGDAVGSGVYIWRVTLNFRDGYLKERVFKMGVFRKYYESDGTCINGL